MRLHFAVAAILAQTAAAQTTVSGIVRDSIARAPLGGAVVQLVAVGDGAQSARTATADAAGRFQISDVPDGRYHIGFFHPVLDTLGVEPPLREVAITQQRPARVDLSTPSAARIRAAVCGDDGQGVAMGVVRDAETRAPIAGATVDAQWTELALVCGGSTRTTRSTTATTRANGWFGLCNLPPRVDGPLHHRGGYRAAKSHRHERPVQDDARNARRKRSEQHDPNAWRACRLVPPGRLSERLVHVRPVWSRSTTSRAPTKSPGSRSIPKRSYQRSPAVG